MVVIINKKKLDCKQSNQTTVPVYRYYLYMRADGLEEVFKPGTWYLVLVVYLVLVHSVSESNLSKQPNPSRVHLLSILGGHLPSNTREMSFGTLKKGV